MAKNKTPMEDTLTANDAEAAPAQANAEAQGSAVEPEPKKRWPTAAQWKASDSMRALASFERLWAAVPASARDLVWAGILEAKERA